MRGASPHILYLHPPNLWVFRGCSLRNFLCPNWDHSLASANSLQQDHSPVKSLRPLLVLVGLLGSVVASHAQFTWTGLGGNTDVSTNGNWLGNVAPPNDGTADLQLGQALFHTLKLSATYDFDSVALTASDSYSITTAGAQTLTLHSGLALSNTVGSSLSDAVS